MTTHVRSVLY